MPGLVVVYDITTGEYLFVNRAIKKLLGYQPQDMIKGGLTFVATLVHPDDLPVVMKQNEEALRKANRTKPGPKDAEPIANFEYRMRHKKGHYVWLHTDGSIYERAADGSVKYVLNVSIDITSRKKSEATLREITANTQTALNSSQEKYQAFIQNSSEGIWRFELEKPIPTNLSVKQQIKLMYERAYLAEANQAVAAMYGAKSVRSLLGMRLGDFLIESDPANIDYLTAFVESGYRLSGVESHEKDLKGNDKYFRNSLVGFVENGKVYRAWGTQQDITNEQKATRALKASEAQLNLALKASRMGIWQWNIKTGELHWSKELKRIFGLKADEDITYEKYISLLHPDERAQSKRFFDKALQNGKSYSIEHRIIWPDGSVHWVAGQGKAILENGKAVGMIGTSFNIDRRKQAEQRLLESQERKRKLELRNALLFKERTELMELNKAKDEFISLASHQLRTPATGVKQYIGMLLEGYMGPLTEKQLQLLQAAYSSNQRQLRIVGDLLNVAKVDAGKVKLVRQPTNIVPLIEDILDEQRAAFATKHQQIEYSYSSPTLMAVIDSDRFRMVLENFIDNASKYSPPDTQVSVQVSDSDQWITIKIIDQGVGIAEGDRALLFHKFSRIENPLSAVAGGSGLGLYWAKKIIDLHGGSVDVKSKVNIGTTFTIKLPKDKE